VTSQNYSVLFTPYCSGDKIEKRIRWAEHVARMGRGEAYTGVCLGNLKERDHLGDPGLDGRIILRWTFRKWYMGYGLDGAGTE
jgi:hypothetical protein